MTPTEAKGLPMGSYIQHGATGEIQRITSLSRSGTLLTFDVDNSSRVDATENWRCIALVDEDGIPETTGGFIAAGMDTIPV